MYFCSSLLEVICFQWLKINVFIEMQTAESSPLTPSPLTQKYKGVDGLFSIAISKAKSLREWGDVAMHSVRGFCFCGLR